MTSIPPPLTYDDALRSRIAGNLAGHERRVLALDERRHAAVAVVVVDSTEGEDRVDPHSFDAESMEALPGGARGLDGRMVGRQRWRRVPALPAGGRAQPPRIAVGAARRAARRG